jgi:signal transduction histidine kinase
VALASEFERAHDGSKLLMREEGTSVVAATGAPDPPLAQASGERAHTDSAIWSELRREQQAWKERALRGITWALSATCVGAALWFALVPSPFPWMVAWLGLSAVALLAAQHVRRLSFAARVGVVIGAVCPPCLYAFARGGYAPNPFIGLETMVVGATLLLGRRVGLALVLFSMLVILAVSLAHSTGLIVREPAWVAMFDSTNPTVGLRLAVIFGLLTTTIVLAVSYVSTRSEELLAAKARSLENLEREQREKERIARDLERNEAAFRKAQELELLGRLAGTMAHDFNNALLVVLSALDELDLQTGLPAATAAPLAAIRAAADQAAATTRKLRAFGPMEPRRTTELALAPLIEKARATFARVLPRNIELTAELLCEANIVADEGELLRVFMNLVLNARDAMREGGALTLRVRRPRAAELGGDFPEPSVVIEVEDTGSGMSDAVKERLFEPFFTTKEAAGTGLGLASVREIVESQGGRIRVTSALERGTTVSIRWPVAPPAGAPVDAVSPTPTSVPDARPAVVLLVDDDATVRLALGRGLERLGFDVVSAADGAAGLLAARRHTGHIDVLCTDCLLPGLPARELITQFRDLHRGRVIVCSGYAPAETGLGADVFDDFLSKPFSIHELAKRIRTLVAN